MGIKGLLAHVSNNIPLAFETIDLIEEIQNYKADKCKPPTLLIDVKEFSQVVVQRDETGIVLGGRHPLYMGVYRKFLAGLQGAGAKLVFFAVGRKLNDEPHIFIPKREQDYLKHVKLLKNIDKNLPIRSILSRKNHPVPDIRSTFAVEHNLIKLCKQYGELHYNYVRHNQEIVQYANEHGDDVLAIIAGDTDYLVFEGNFEYWPAIRLNFRDSTGVRVNRELILNELELTQQQLAMVGALSGSIYLPGYIDKMKEFYTRLRKDDTKFSKIPDLAEYVRRMPQTQVNDELQFDLEFVAKDIFGDDYTEGELNAIKNGLAIYNLKFNIPTVADPLLRTLMHRDRLLYKLQTDDIFNVRDIVYIDYENVRSKTYDELVCPLLQRILGILFGEKCDSAFTRKICMKFSHDDPYEVVEQTPIYPPKVLRIPFKVIYEEHDKNQPKKWRLLMWTLGIEDCGWDALKNLPNERLITPVATLMYLVMNEEISIPEADAILRTEYTARMHQMPRKIEYERCLNGRAVRVAHLYTKIYELVCACFRVSGLPHLSDFIQFDGGLFHMYAVTHQPPALKRTEIMKPLEPYRLYADTDGSAE